MLEYLGEAIVLHREPTGELDSRVYFFTKKYGRLAARATSARKITSKLSGHMEPGLEVKVRLVEQHGIRVADSLKTGRVSAAPMDLFMLHKILPENEPEPAIWQMLIQDKFSWPAALKILGWDPQGAACASCGKPPAAFNISDQNFYCRTCSLSIPREDAILI